MGSAGAGSTCLRKRQANSVSALGGLPDRLLGPSPERLSWWVHGIPSQFPSQVTLTIFGEHQPR